MADVSIKVSASGESTIKSPWSQWAISTSGKYHLAQPTSERTKCNAPIEADWKRIGRREVLPPPTSSPKEKRKKSMCRGCKRKGGL